MIRCRRFRRQIQLFVGGDLEARAASRLQLHLQSCPACAASLRSLQQSQEAVRSAVDAAVPEWSPLWPEIRAACSQVPRRPALMREWLPSGSLAAACVAVVMGAWLLPTDPRQSTLTNVAVDARQSRKASVPSAPSAGPALPIARDREFLLPEAHLVSGTEKEQF